MYRPSFLKVGDKVAIVSPSGAVDPDFIDGAAALLRAWGFCPVLGFYAKSRRGRFSGSDEERLSDLQWAMDDPSVRAILCGRGGYGAVRIVDGLDFTAFSESPKWLVGFSDITVLHWALFSQGFQSVHAVMAKAMAQIDANREPVEALRAILQGNLPELTGLPAHPLNRMGNANGTLFGGNLSVLYGLRGTRLDVSRQGDILFIEDLSERPYHIDRMMQNLRIGGVLESLSGLLVGRFSDIEEDPLFGQTVEEMIASAVDDYDYPVAFNFPVGHVALNMPVIHGAEINLSVTEQGGAVRYLCESAVEK
ncbi:MAG: LD-carboxypeptidase [Paludibacteraceae bacterium]